MSYGRRLVRVLMSPEIVGRFIAVDNETHSYRVLEGLPPDAEFAGSSFDHETLEVSLFFRHESFEEVRPGGRIPVVCVRLEAVR